MNDLQTLRAHLNARIDALDAQSKAAVNNSGKLDYAAMQEATRLQTALDVLKEYAPDPAARILPTAEMFGVKKQPARPARDSRGRAYCEECEGYACSCRERESHNGF